MLTSVPLIPRRIWVGLLLAAFGSACASRALLSADDVALVRSRQSGRWSDATTWEAGRPPKSGERVLVRAGHRVVYDVESLDVIRLLQIAGTVEFADDRDTRLDVGLVKIIASEEISEDGFDCHAVLEPPAEGKERPALIVGLPEKPIPAEHRAVIRLTHVAGMDAKTCPAIVVCGGRMELHGAPLARTWVKLFQTGRVGEAKVVLPRIVADWKVGDRIVLTGTTRQIGYTGTRQMPDANSVLDRPSTEVRTITAFTPWGGLSRQYTIVSLDAPLAFDHTVVGEFAAEAANLSRNVIVESANPDGVRGHTMYHRHSTGSISYAEFRHLGKEGVLGKYALHFHLCGNTMRGSSVIGASIWDSKNRWLTIHGTNYLVVRDCVGYKSIGHGFFLEDGTEVYNVLDRNLAVMATKGKPLPEQVLPYDENVGSGFWWANSLNTFTNNVAAENDADGFRFEVVKRKDFDPVLKVMQPDGQERDVDIRTLPFVRFDGNEAHCHRLFAINLGGFNVRNFTKAEKDVAGVGPDRTHPFILRNTKVWDAHWGFHTGSPCVRIEGMKFEDCLYGLWRCVLTGHEHHFVDYGSTMIPLFEPRGAAGGDGNEDYTADRPVDDLPPVTAITHVTQLPTGAWRVRGVTNDNYEVSQVDVNGRAARATAENFSQWEIELAELPPSEVVSAHAIDAAGNVERLPHVRILGNPDSAAELTKAARAGVR